MDVAGGASHTSWSTGRCEFYIESFERRLVGRCRFSWIIRTQKGSLRYAQHLIVLAVCLAGPCLHDRFARIDWHEHDPEACGCAGGCQRLDADRQAARPVEAVEQGEGTRIRGRVAEPGERALEQSRCKATVEAGNATIPAASKHSRRKTPDASRNRFACDLDSSKSTFPCPGVPGCRCCQFCNCMLPVLCFDYEMVYVKEQHVFHLLQFRRTPWKTLETRGLLHID